MSDPNKELREAVKEHVKAVAANSNCELKSILIKDIAPGIVVAKALAEKKRSTKSFFVFSRN